MFHFDIKFTVERLVSGLLPNPQEELSTLLICFYTTKSPLKNYCYIYATGCQISELNLNRKQEIL